MSEQADALVSKVEQFFGRTVTKLVLVALVIPIIGLAVKTVLDMIVYPLLKVSRSIGPSTDWGGSIQIVLTVITGIFAGSWMLDAYRIRGVREDYERTVAEVNEIIAEAKRVKAELVAEYEGRIDGLTATINQATALGLRSQELLAASSLTAEAMFEQAEQGRVFSEGEVASLRVMLDEVQHAAQASVAANLAFDDPNSAYASEARDPTS